MLNITDAPIIRGGNSASSIRPTLTSKHLVSEIRLVPWKDLGL